jgi:DNA-binding MarR family transcriptional regulator
MRPDERRPSGERAGGTVTRARLQSRFEEADDSTGLVLWRVTNAWQAAQRKALKPFGITHVQFVLLASLTWLEGEEPVTQRALATHAGVDAMMTSQVLRALERAGQVERLPHPTDGRAMGVKTTAAGREVANRAIVVIEAVDAEFFAPLGDDRARFTRLLDGLA